MTEKGPDYATITAPELTAKRAFLAAFAKAQGAFESISKNREAVIVERDSSGFTHETKFRYADLDAIIAATRPALSAHGFSVTQTTRQNGDSTELVTTLCHEDGHEVESVVKLVSPAIGSLKEYGIQMGYLRRYEQSAILNISASDDIDQDGKPASEKTAKAENAGSSDDLPFEPDLMPVEAVAAKPESDNPDDKPEDDGGPRLTAGQCKTIANKAGDLLPDLLEVFGAESLADAPRSALADMLEWIKAN